MPIHGWKDRGTKCPGCNHGPLFHDPAHGCAHTVGMAICNCMGPCEFCGAPTFRATLDDNRNVVFCQDCRKVQDEPCELCALSRLACEDANTRQMKCCPDCTHPAGRLVGARARKPQEPRTEPYYCECGLYTQHDLEDTSCTRCGRPPAPF